MTGKLEPEDAGAHRTAPVSPEGTPVTTPPCSRDPHPAGTPSQDRPPHSLLKDPAQAGGFPAPCSLPGSLSLTPQGRLSEVLLWGLQGPGAFPHRPCAPPREALPFLLAGTTLLRERGPWPAPAMRGRRFCPSLAVKAAGPILCYFLPWPVSCPHLVLLRILGEGQRYRDGRPSGLMPGWTPSRLPQNQIPHSHMVVLGLPLCWPWGPPPTCVPGGSSQPRKTLFREPLSTAGPSHGHLCCGLASLAPSLPFRDIWSRTWAVVTSTFSPSASGGLLPVSVLTHAAIVLGPLVLCSILSYSALTCSQRAQP